MNKTMVLLLACFALTASIAQATEKKQICAVQMYYQQSPLVLEASEQMREPSGHDIEKGFEQELTRAPQVTEFSRGRKMKSEKACVDFTVRTLGRWLQDPSLKAKIAKDDFDLDQLRICYAYPLTNIVCAEVASYL